MFNCTLCAVWQVPPAAVWKALPGWLVLARHHAQAIVDLEAKVGGELWPAFAKVFAPEELFFPTMLALAGYAPDAGGAHPRSGAGQKREGDGPGAGPEPAAGSGGGGGGGGGGVVPQSQVVLRPLVFAQYPTTGENRANPVALDGKFGAAELADMRARGFLVVRKFKEPLPDELQALLVDPEVNSNPQGHEERNLGALAPSLLPRGPLTRVNRGREEERWRRRRSRSRSRNRDREQDGGGDRGYGARLWSNSRQSQDRDAGRGSRSSSGRRSRSRSRSRGR